MAIITFADAENRLIKTIQKIKLSASYPSTYKGVDDPLGELLGFKIKEQTLNSEYGLYIGNPTNDGVPIVAIDPKGSDVERLNFTYFHEVSHHLIRSDDELYSFFDELAAQNEDLYSLKERFANIGAAEFLLPSSEVREFISKRSFSISLIKELDQSYPASKPAIAIQLARYASHKCIVVICHFGVLPGKLGGQTNLPTLDNTEANNTFYVQYSASSPSNKYSIAKYAHVPRNHFLWGVYEQKLDITKGQALIPFRKQMEWKTDCEGMYYKGKVYAVFNIEKPPPSSDLQPRLL
jgi:Zn-dependent peptidase ImmA (M78 family)